MRAARHRRRAPGEDLAAGVAALSDVDLELLRKEAVEEEASLAYAEKLFTGRLDLAQGEARRRELAGPTADDDGGGVNQHHVFSREDVASLLGDGGLPGLAGRTDTEIIGAVSVLEGHVERLREDLERVRTLVTVAEDERTRRHG